MSSSKKCLKVQTSDKIKHKNLIYNLKNIKQESYDLLSSSSNDVDGNLSIKIDPHEDCLIPTIRENRIKNEVGLLEEHDSNEKSNIELKNKGSCSIKSEIDSYINTTHLVEIKLENEFGTDAGENGDSFMSIKMEIEEQEKRNLNLDYNNPGTSSGSGLWQEIFTIDLPNGENTSTKPLSIKKFRCPQPHCPYISKEINHFNVHLHSEHSNNDKYFCEECQIEITSAFAIRRHNRLKHNIVLPDDNFEEVLEDDGGEEPLKDNLVHYTSNISQDFISENVHTIGENGNIVVQEILSFNCTSCPYTTFRERHLKAHVLNRHTKERSWRCKECSYVGKTDSAFYAHHRRKHTNDWLPCPICKIKFKTKANLEKHAKIKHASVTSAADTFIESSNGSFSMPPSVMSDTSQESMLETPTGGAVDGAQTVKTEYVLETPVVKSEDLLYADVSFQM